MFKEKQNNIENDIKKEKQLASRVTKLEMALQNASDIKKRFKRITQDIIRNT